MTARITIECLECDCMIMIKYTGPRERDLHAFCGEIAEALQCMECGGNEVITHGVVS